MRSDLVPKSHQRMSNLCMLAVYSPAVAASVTIPVVRDDRATAIKSWLDAVFNYYTIKPTLTHCGLAWWKGISKDAVLSKTRRNDSLSIAINRPFDFSPFLPGNDCQRLTTNSDRRCLL